MGNYLNPGSQAFQMILDSQIFVDKSGLIAVANRYIRTMQRYMCVSRPRRFGKSTAADMLAAYYGREQDAAYLFDKLKISQEQSYRKHLNQYDVIKINMQEFLSMSESVEEMLHILQNRLLKELKKAYPEYMDSDRLVFAMQDIYAETKCQFVILIDEWDCLFREYKQDKESQRKYLDFLRMWLKDKDYVALAYMTGILPIKKYGSHSALNMFSEYSMLNPREMAEFFGFTEEEVRELCSKYNRSFEEAKAWYNGYELTVTQGQCEKTYAMYNPKSVVDAMISGIFDNYWNQTETYEALKAYICMNYDGLKEAVIKMLAGEKIHINTGTFSNDMTSFQGRDDVLTLLVHLGYLSYHWPDKTVGIPNKEVSQEYVNAISTMNWSEVIQSVEASKKLLQALWDMDAAAVAEGIDRAHREISILQYNDENFLSCTINLAFYFAREYYTIIRELPSGKGFADICFIPRKLYGEKPAAVIELKWDKCVEGAIDQIKKKQYVDALRDYHGNLLLAGINYDRKTKKHSCVIERYEME
ncbi:AAA family ATPase [Blautia sp. MSJ-19]|uniref:AAA family ATPase n=1 Tax=Blautia sp. MSJ-19 TaxID=2841517 RepID=UPI001C0F2B09|nr:AAA family ATPase [Blautia sp. MSJ-19]MBU5480135.1 ATP-binding protein [Blautia sp. MSJ-19]